MSSQSVEKKRKRRSESDRHSRKRHAVDGDHAEVNGTTTGDSIKLIHSPKDDQFMPVLASSPGLIIPHNTTFQAYRRSAHNNELLLHSSNHPKLDYTAREQQDGAIENQTKHYIGIYDAEKQEMQIIEAKKMSVRSTLREEEAEFEKERNLKQSSNLSVRQELGLEFGTKKAKKLINSLADNAIMTMPSRDLATSEAIKNSIQQNPSAAAVIESMAAGAENAPSKAELQAAINNAKPRPKHNTNAKKPEDVYPIEDIVGEDVMKLVKVKPWFEAIKKGDAVKTTSLFVANRLDTIVGDGDVETAKVLKYLLSLIQFLGALRKSKNGRKIPKRHDLESKVDVDGALLNVVRRRFTSGGSDMTKWQVDNLITHMAALALIVDDFEHDMHDLREDLGITSKEMDKYFKETGAKLVPMNDTQRQIRKLTKEEASMHKIAKLVIPLQFPKERTLARKRR